MIDSVVFDLMKSFNGSFINEYGEFIAHDKANAYFNLSKCEDDLQVKCKVIEWFSRPSYKTAPFRTDKKNQEFNSFMLNGVNKFLGTNFTESDMEIIYTKLGNEANRDLTLRFIIGKYDMNVLKEESK